MMIRVYAMIPARSGSKGLPHKNIADLGGAPLLAHAISFGLKLPVERVFVSTDSENYRRIAREYGAEVPQLRGEQASGDKAREEHILADFETWGIAPPDIWVWLKPTNPFRNVYKVEKGLEFLSSRSEVDSVRIVSEADRRLQVIAHNMGGVLVPLDPQWPAGKSKIPRDLLPQAYFPYNLEIFRHRGFKLHFSEFMGKAIWPIVDHKVTGLDIDDMFTLQLCRALVAQWPEELAPYLHLPRGN